MTPEESRIMFEMGQKITDMGKHLVAIDGKISGLCTAVGKVPPEKCAVHDEKLKKIESTQSTILKSGFGVGAMVIIVELFRFLFTVGVI